MSECYDDELVTLLYRDDGKRETMKKKTLGATVCGFPLSHCIEFSGAHSGYLVDFLGEDTARGMLTQRSDGANS